MAKHKQKYPAQRNSDYCYRIALPHREAVDAEQRSIRMTLATEMPVPVLDFQRMEVVNEVLRMDGLKLPSQIPLLDSHDINSARSVVGSIRDFERKDGELHASAYFASNASGQALFDLYREGHLTDFSIGATRDQKTFVERGQTYDLNGQILDGPVRIVEQATVREGSAVAMGADENAKAHSALRAYVDPYTIKDEIMWRELREKLISRGMPEDVEDAGMLEWLERNLADVAGRDDKKATDELIELVRSLKTEAVPVTTTAATVDVGSSVEDAEKTILAERNRIKEISDLCRSTEVDEKTRDGWIERGMPVDQVAREILKLKATSGAPLGNNGTIEVARSQREKFYEAARSGLIINTIRGAGLNPAASLERAEKLGDIDSIQRARDLNDVFQKPADGHEQFRHVGISDLARMFLVEAGDRVDGLPKHEIVRRALAMPDFVNRAGDGAAYHTTGSFTHLMLDAANKTLLGAYDEAEVTYPLWVRTAPSAADFKLLRRIRFGELPDPEVVPENHEYPEKAPVDAREEYRVEKYGEIFSISLESIVNDDLNAISRIPQMQGAAMRRKINKVVYAILTANANLNDGTALFAAGHSNTASNALAVTALDTGFAAMMTQTGLSGTGTILNLVPRFLIVPAALAATALQIVASITPPAVGGTATGTSGTANLYGPGGRRPLSVVDEGQLDGNSATAWYLAANNGQVDTVELTFLSGEESPVLEREDGFSTDTVKYKIRQTFNAKAIDHRGLYRGNT